MKRASLCLMIAFMVTIVTITSTFAQSSEGDPWDRPGQEIPRVPEGSEVPSSEGDSWDRPGQEIPRVPKGSKASSSPRWQRLALALLAVPAGALNGALTAFEDRIEEPAHAGGFQAIHEIISLTANAIGFAFYALPLYLLYRRYWKSKKKDFGFEDE